MMSLGTGGCTLDPLDDRADDGRADADGARTLEVEPWPWMRLVIAWATEDLEEAYLDGHSMADVGCVYDLDDPVASCLQVVSAPDASASACVGVVHAGFVGLTPQRSIEHGVDDTMQIARVWTDPEVAGGLRCMEVYEDGPSGTTCLYKDCLLDGTASWSHAVMQRWRIQMHDSLRQALRLAGATPLDAKDLGLAMLDAFEEAVAGEVTRVTGG